MCHGWMSVDHDESLYSSISVLCNPGSSFFEICVVIGRPSDQVCEMACRADEWVSFTTDFAYYWID